MNLKQPMAAVLTAAAACGVLMTGCGRTHNIAEHAAETHTKAAAETTVRREHAATTAPDRDADPFDYDEQPHATSGPDIIDRAESVIDEAGDAVTGLLTDAAEETHRSR